MNIKNKKKFLLISVCIFEALIIIASIVFLITINYNNSADKGSPLDSENPFARGEATDQQAYMNFEDVISESNLIVEGLFVGKHQRTGYYELEFKIKNRYLGKYNDSTIMVYAVPDTQFLDNDTYYTLDYDQFKENEEYLLFLQRVVSVYYDSDRYIHVGDIVYPLNDPESATMFGKPIDESARQLASQIASTGVHSKLNVDLNAENKYIGVDFINASKLDDIAGYAEYVLRVKIGDYVFNNADLGTTAYSCEVLDSYSGSVSDSLIIINFFDDDVQPGEEYIVFLNKAGEDSIVYALASKEHSVLEATEANINAAYFNLSVSLLLDNNTPVPFHDVEMYDWFYDSVAFVNGVDLMSGSSNDMFYPNENVTREEVISVLGRLHELMRNELTLLSTPFHDVTNPSTYYYKFIGWGYNDGIINGISNTEFGVGRTITRQDFCTMLYRYAAFIDHGLTATGSISFLDANKISSYAVSAVSACANGGIIEGFGDGTFLPQDNIKRSQVAQMMTKYIQRYLN